MKAAKGALMAGTVGSYRMRFDLMGEHTGIPALQVAINGHRGRFYQHPALNCKMGDAPAAWFPTYSTPTITFTFPASYLKLGQNRIELTAVDDRLAGRLTPDPPSWAGDSGIVYDAISLEHVASDEYAPDETTAQILPSIFYHRNDDGRLRLFDRQKKIEITFNLKKQEIFRKEGVYFAFPRALKTPKFRYQLQTRSIDPSRDMLAGAGLETFSVQHWINAAENGISATVFPVDAPMVALGDFVRGTFPTEFGRRNCSLFSFLMSNYHYDNWPGSQGGEFRFRYAFTSSPETDASALTRMGWEEATPLEINEVTTQDKAVDIPRCLPASMSFAEIDRSDILLQTWKVAEDGNGTILRFLNFGDEQETVSVSLPFMKATSAWLCSALEHNRSEIPLKDMQHLFFEIRPHEITTARLTSIAEAER